MFTCFIKKSKFNIPTGSDLMAKKKKSGQKKLEEELELRRIN